MSGNPQFLRRRRGGDRVLTRVTFEFDEGLLKAVRAAVSEDESQSASAFVEDALRKQLREVRRARLDASYEQASHDSEFLAALASTTRALEATVGDGLAHVPE